MSTAELKLVAPTLPAPFADLERFADWALPTLNARFDKRLTSSMEEIQAVYDALLPRVDAMLDFLGDKSFDDYSEEERNLLYLVYALAAISFPVEVWKQPHIPDAGASYIHMLNEPQF